MRACAAGALLFLVACGPSAAPGPRAAAARESILGGSASPGDDAVYMVLLQADTGAKATCSATLIAPQTLLTAAHCADPQMLGATTLTIKAMNKQELAQATPADLVSVVETRLHPGWNRQTLADDLALLSLAQAQPGTPRALNTTSVASLTGAPLRSVGYGTSGGNTGDGVRRTVDLTFRLMTAKLIRVGDQTGAGVCHGDSGGPSFHTFPDGRELLVGVHSFTLSDACTDGADTRVDAYTPFIRDWLMTHEPPSCADDGRCKEGCTPVDLDCVCATDGQCTAACPAPDRDADCPRNCAADGICAQAPCPVADADCVAVGAACASASQCMSSLCVTDATHAQAYCSVACKGDGDCPGPLSCELAVGVCHHSSLPVATLLERCGPGSAVCAEGLRCASGQCETLCTTDRDCATSERCEGADGGARSCHAERTPLGALASVHGPAAPRCEASAGIALTWLAALAFRAAGEKRRRRSTRLPR